MAVTAQVNIKIDASQATQTVGTLEADLRATRQELTKVMKTYGDNSKEADNLRKSITNLEYAITQLGGSTTDLDAKFDDLYDGALPLSGRLGEIEDRLYELALAGQQSSQEFVDLEREAGRLRQTMIQTDMRIDAMALTMSQKLSGAIGGLLGAFAAAQGATALFGVESEELNKKLLKVQGALALLQGYEAFRQSLPSIKALGTSIAALIAPTTAAAGATTGLGVAMNALPILGIATAITALTYGIYQYATASGEAEEQEKKAAKQREILEKRTKALEEAQDKERQQVASTSIEYFNLIQKLKDTNNGSTQREKLIKQINAQYGTTLKNLKDENLFQSQLNLSVKEYIALQVLKVKQESNKENEEKAIKNLLAAQQELNKFQKEYAGLTEKEISDYDIKTYGVSVYNDTLIKLNGQLENANTRAEKYAINNEKLQKEINKLTVTFKNETGVINTNTSAKDDNVKSTEEQITAEESLEAQLQNTNKQYTDTLKFIQDLVNISKIDTPTPKIIDDIQKVVDARNALEDKTLQDVFKELGIGVSVINGSFGIFTDKLEDGEDAFGSFYENIRKTLTDGSVNESIIDFGNTVNNFVDQASEKLNQGLITKEAFNALVGITDQYEKFNKLINLTPEVFSPEKLQPFFEATKEIGIATDLINYEKVNGDLEKIEEVTVKLSEAQKKQQDAVAGYQKGIEDYYLEQFKLKQLSFETIVNNSIKEKEERKKLLEEAGKDAEKQKAIIRDIAKTQAEGIANIVITVTEEENEIRNFLGQSIELRKKNLKETDELVKKALLNNTELLIKETQKNNGIVLDLNKSAEENLFSFQKQMSLKNIDLTKFTEEEKLKIVQQYLDAQADAIGETELDKLQTQLDAIDDYLASFQSLFSDFESALTNVTEQENQKRTQAIQDSLDQQTALLDAQLAQRLITQEEYDNQVLQLRQQQEQEEREIAKKSFQTNKRLNLVGATIDGARAVLSTFASTPGELIIKSIAATLAGVFAATQIAVIAKSSFQAATGGIVPGMGSGEIDSVSATLAPGEAVINKKSTDQFLPILDAINQAGGGRSLMPNLPATNQNQRFEVVFPDNKQQQPVRAYVVESDISDAQKRVNRIENSTRF